MPSISYSSSVSLHYTTASARHARMPSRQEAVEKESESTASSSGPRQGSSTNVQGAKQAGYPYSGFGYGGAMSANNSSSAKSRLEHYGTWSEPQAGATQPYDWREPTECGAQPARLHPPTLQDNSSGHSTKTMDEFSASSPRSHPSVSMDDRCQPMTSPPSSQLRLVQDNHRQSRTPTSSPTHISFSSSDYRRSPASSSSPNCASISPTGRLQPSSPPSPPQMTFFSDGRCILSPLPSANSPPHTRPSPTDCLLPFASPTHPQMNTSSGNHVPPSTPSSSALPCKSLSSSDHTSPLTRSPTALPHMAASSSSRAQPMTSPTPRASTGASKNESPPNPASIDNSTPSTNPPPTNRPTSVSVTYPNGDPTKNGTPRSTLLLVDYKLWDKFHQQKNEMIITNDGRCLFPCLRFTAIDLDPNAYYGIRVDFEMLTPVSLRFDVNDGEWRPHETLGDSTGDHQDSQDCNGSSRNDLNTLQESYMHPDGFKPGIHWMSNKISFAKVKLTNEDYDEDESSSTNKKKKRSAKPKPASVNANNKKRSAKHESSSTNTNGNHNEPSRDDGSATNYTNTRIFHMKSFHKYIPRIHLMQWDENSRAIISSTEFRYETTEFTAVTHYQNYNVTQLKILHNPHAKGKVRKVLPPVEIPSDSHSTSTTSRSLVKKRSHSELRSSQRDSDGMIEDGDLGSDGPEESEMAVDTSSAGTSNGGIKKRPRLSSTSKGKAPSVGNGRIHMAQGGYNNMCRIDEDNDALVVISLGRGPTADAKVSEHTSRHHFSQQGSSNGESIAIAGFRSRSTTNKVSWTGQRTQTTASTRAIERTSRSGGDMYGSNQQRKHQHPQQQPLMISNYQSRNTSQLTMPGQLSPPSQQRNIDRARTNRMDPLPSHLSDFDLPSILGSPSITPIPNFDVDASASASASSGTGDDGDTDLLQFNQPTPLISLVSLDDDTMPDQTALQVSPSNLEGLALAVNETTDTLMMDPNPPPPALSWSQQSLLEQNPTNIPQDLTPAATTTASSVVAEDATGTDLPWTMQLAGQNSTGYFPETSLTSVSSSSRPRGYGLSLSPNFSQPFSQSTSSMLLTPGSYVDNDGAGMVPGFSTFGTLTPSLNNGSNTRSGPSPIPSGRSRSDSGMSANYGYGNSGGSNLHQGPRMTRMTILDSRTFMSTSPAMSHMPEANNNLQANIDSILRENMRLKAFIRERYGVEAEAEANAVVAMDHQ